MEIFHAPFLIDSTQCTDADEFRSAISLERNNADEVHQSTVNYD